MKYTTMAGAMAGCLLAAAVAAQQPPDSVDTDNLHHFGRALPAMRETFDVQ
jgi:hypothetical protein